MFLSATQCRSKDKIQYCTVYRLSPPIFQEVLQLLVEIHKHLTSSFCWPNRNHSRNPYEMAYPFHVPLCGQAVAALCEVIQYGPSQVLSRKFYTQPGRFGALACCQNLIQRWNERKHSHNSVQKYEKRFLQGHVQASQHPG